MATGTIQYNMPQQIYLGRVSGTTTTTDLSPYLTHFGYAGPSDASNSCAILVILKGWATGTNYASVYMLTTIQNNGYQELVELGKNGPAASISSGVLTVNWTTNSGGTITLLKIG